MFLAAVHRMSSVSAMDQPTVSSSRHYTSSQSSPSTSSRASATSGAGSPSLKRPLSYQNITGSGSVGGGGSSGSGNASPTSPRVVALSGSLNSKRNSREGARYNSNNSSSGASSPHKRQSPSIKKSQPSMTPRQIPQSPLNPATSGTIEAVDKSFASTDISSPAKRTKSTPSMKRILPREYYLCPMPELVILISDMLNQLVSMNDDIPLTSGGLTRFHSRAPPTISIHDYVHRIMLHTTLEPSTVLSMVYYIDLLSQNYQAFNISSLTVHRFLITAATVASKGLCDSFCTNTFYARVGGVSLRELNVLELEFLGRVRWRIVPQAKVLQEYYQSLVARMGEGWALEPVRRIHAAVGGLSTNEAAIVAGIVTPPAQESPTSSKTSESEISTDESYENDDA